MKTKKFAFIFFSIAMTSISVIAGYKLYLALLGAVFAIMISGIFETARLLFLFLAIYSKRKMKIIGFLLYFAIASVCASVAVTSFYHEINKSEKDSISELQDRSGNIAVKYARYIDEKISDIENSDWYRRCQNNMTYFKDKGSVSYQTWLNRLNVEQKKIDDLKAERENNLLLKNSNQKRFLATIGPIVGETGKESSAELQANAISKSLSELWGLSETRAKKLLGIIITIIVELVIFFMALLSKINNGKSRKEIILSENEKSLFDRFELSRKNIDEINSNSTIDEVRSYLLNHYEHYNSGEKFLRRIQELKNSGKDIFNNTYLSNRQIEIRDELISKGIDVRKLL